MGKGESIRVRSPAADRGAVEVAAGWGMRVPPQGPPSQLERLRLYPKGTGAPVRGFHRSRNRWDPPVVVLTIDGGTGPVGGSLGIAVAS